jgi:hypothetical protein
MLSGVGQPKFSSIPAGLSLETCAALAASRLGSEPRNWIRTGVPARVRDEFLSSGLMRVKAECGSTVELTRTNSVTHQS